jgi:hypothetical protein
MLHYGRLSLYVRSEALCPFASFVPTFVGVSSVSCWVKSISRYPDDKPYRFRATCASAFQFYICMMYYFMCWYRFIIQTHTTLEHCTFIYLFFYYMFRPFYSAIIRQKHKNIIGKVRCGRDLSFTISVIKYIKLAVIIIVIRNNS